MSKNKNRNSFIPYPEIVDDDFNEKIYIKKEFRDYEIKEEPDLSKELQIKKNFTLDYHQIFLKNYISPDTPYNGILIFHGTGVGKTCTALSIAEGFKKTLKNINKKILILANNINENFIKELYDFKKEQHKSNQEDNVQCTGKAYELGEESLYLTREQKEKAIRKMKSSYYQFFGYKKFANYIINNTGGWKGSEKDISEKVKNFISKEFDNRVIIIDEIQNIKTDRRDISVRSIQPILQSIIKYGKNIKLILMSATPMFDRPDEIIFYINLLLQNDGREKIEKNDIFNIKDGTLKPTAEKQLKDILKGYVSYIRGERPLIFPFRIYTKDSIIPKIEYTIGGKKLNKQQQLQYTELILCQMQKVQLNTYYNYLQKITDEKLKIDNIDNIDENLEDSEESEDSNDMKGSKKKKEKKLEIETFNNINDKKTMRMLIDLSKISNITFPIIDSDIGSVSRQSINSDSDNGLGGYYKFINTSTSVKYTQYKYQSHAIFNKDTVNETPFADEKYLSNYSIKFSKILDVIKKAKGLVLIYSKYIEFGALPLALMLEQNGIQRSCGDGEEQLLNYTANKLGKGGIKRPICYLCGNEQKKHNDSDHTFKFAKYILFFGETKDIIKVSKKNALDRFNSNKNKYGEEIKIFIGTKAISEGLDFKRLRQVHIMEPWYNLARHEQIIGRAIRNLSHIDLLPEERNVEIYQYAATLEDNNNQETIDLKNYSIAEGKDIIIKNISRVMKEAAVDCVLFRKINIIHSNQKVKQITSSGNTVNIPIADKPYSSICDYKENCYYDCDWTPNPKKKYPINTDTYNITFAENDIEQAKNIIKNMFKENIVYHLKIIENNVIQKIPKIDKLFIYKALEDIVDNKNAVIYDKFFRKGYIIYRGDYYIFQPFDIERDDIPIIYRLEPTSTKQHYVNIENIELNYSDVKIVNTVSKIDETKFIDRILLNIDAIYNSHEAICNGVNKKKYIYAIIGFITDKLTKDYENIFIKNILIKYLNKSTDKYIDDIVYILNQNNKLINYYADVLYDKNHIKDNIYVGYIIDKESFIIDTLNKDGSIKMVKYNNLNFVKCSPELIQKIKSHKSIGKEKDKVNTNKQYNIIYGIVEFDKKKYIKKFKIVDKSSEEGILTKEKKLSKRSIITGRICSTFQIGKLLELRKKINMYNIEGKRRIEFICEDIEIYMRFKKLINDDDKIWFEEVNV